MHYLDKTMSKGLTAILISKMLLFVVGGLLGVFVPIFIYQQLGQSVSATMLYFGIASLVFWISLPIGVRFLDRLGFKYALIMSAAIGALYYFIFYLGSKEVISVSVFVVLSMVLLTAYRSAYWVPFHTEFSKFSDAGDRGRHVSLFSAGSMLIGIFLPTVAALLINQFGFVVFLIAVVVMFISGVPYFFMPLLPETYAWSVRQTWSEFRCRAKSRVAISFMAEGVENIIAMFLWPVFLYQLFEGDLLDVGAVSTLIIAGSIVLQLVVGRAIDRFHQADNALKWGSILYAVGWVLKIFIATTFQVFVVGVYHAISKIFTETPAHTLAYDMTSVNDEYVDEFTVLREMFINAGRFGGAMVSVLLLFFVSVQWVFLIGAIAALTFHFISNRDFDLKRCL